jgi:hypothetical protein
MKMMPWKPRKPKRPSKPKRPKVTRSDAWRSVAERTGGDFVEARKPAKERVLVRHGPWRVWLDTYVVSNGSTSQTYTRVRAYVRGWRGMSLLVRRRGVLDRLWETLGFGSRLPVSRALTDRYVVKGKPEPRVPSLFSAQGLTGAVMAVPSLRLEIKRPSRKSRKRFGEDAGVVVCRTTGVITDVDRLAGMIAVVREALDSLHRVGEAREEEVPDS